VDFFLRAALFAVPPAPAFDLPHIAFSAPAQLVHLLAGEQHACHHVRDETSFGLGNLSWNGKVLCMERDNTESIQIQTVLLESLSLRFSEMRMNSTGTRRCNMGKALSVL
jgi:hypothetical protein